MAVRSILVYPDPLLARVALPVERVDDAIRALIDDMFDTMHDECGVGLAAPQVGVSLRVLVMQIPEVEDGEEVDSGPPIALINPEIVERDGEVVWNEGCLSLPGVDADVERSARVVVSALDRDGQPTTFAAEGLAAVCLQHEVDHLDGVVFLDQLGPLERRAVLAEYTRGAETELEPDSELAAVTRGP